MLYLAVKQLFARKKQTALILIGVSFGTMIYVLIAGVQLGLREYISGQLMNNTSHVRISGSDRTIDGKDLTMSFFPGRDIVHWLIAPMGKRGAARLENYLGHAHRLENDPDVYNFAPKLTIPVLVTRAGLRANSELIGIIPSRQMQVTALADYMREGKLQDLESAGGRVVLASGVAEKLGVTVGGTVLLTSGQNEGRPFKVTGIIHLGNHNFDDVVAYAHLRDVQTLGKAHGRVSEISIALVDSSMAYAKAEAWSLLGPDKVEDWERANAAYMQIVKIQDIARFVITVSILIVAAFGIYNILTIMISQKKREIAILRSMGFGAWAVFELFFIQGFVIGVLGGPLGLLIGYTLCRIVGNIDLGFQIGRGNHLLISYNPDIYFTALGFALLSGALASILPAVQAGQMTPMDIIREDR
ncbi:MAG: ABC transporter permease [Bdellovibrio sp.]|nr:ABC transporter permease [Bdellovibrio sp.]